MAGDGAKIKQALRLKAVDGRAGKNNTG